MEGGQRGQAYRDENRPEIRFFKKKNNIKEEKVRQRKNNFRIFCDGMAEKYKSIKAPGSIICYLTRSSGFLTFPKFNKLIKKIK